MRTQTRTVIATSVIVALIALTSWSLTRPVTTKVSTPPTIPVHVISVVKEDVPRYVTGIGSVLSLHSVIVRPQVDGILTKLLVKEGQLVKAGDLLATIDDRSIRATLDQAQAQLGQSQAQLDVAQIDLKRYRLLTTDNGISKQTFDQQQALVHQLQATALGNQASINAAQVQLSYTQIRSPVTGRVGIRNVDEGNFLRVSDAQGLFSERPAHPAARSRDVGDDPALIRRREEHALSQREREAAQGERSHARARRYPADARGDSACRGMSR